METSAYLTFALLAFSMTAAPGPNLFLVLHHAIGGSIGHAGSAIAGICVSLLIHSGLALLGLSILVTGTPGVFVLVKLLGATYVFYLGVQALGSFRRESMAQVQDKEKHSIHGRSKAFKDGLLMGVLNPYTSIFILTVTPQFLVASKNPIAMVLGALIATMAIIKIVWFGSMAVILSKLNALVKCGAFTRYLNLFSGVALVLLGADLMRRALM